MSIFEKLIVAFVLAVFVTIPIMLAINYKYEKISGQLDVLNAEIKEFGQ